MKFYLFLIMMIVAALCVSAKKSKSSSSSSDDEEDGTCSVDCTDSPCLLFRLFNVDEVCGQNNFDHIKAVIKAKVTSDARVDGNVEEFDIQVLEVFRSYKKIKGEDALLRLTRCTVPTTCIIVQGLEYFFFIDNIKKRKGTQVLKYTTDDPCFTWARRSFSEMDATLVRNLVADNCENQQKDSKDSSGSSDSSDSSDSSHSSHSSHSSDSSDLKDSKHSSDSSDSSDSKHSGD